MGRHGGGSRSGGSRSSSRSRSSGGGSRSGGSSIRTSTTPFKGCYNRSYYDRRGRYHTYYTSSRSFGTKSGWSFMTVFALVFVTMHMLIMASAILSSVVVLGGKVNGSVERIKIMDIVDVLTAEEEAKTLELFNKVYDESGMPISLYTDSFQWKDRYNSLEIYSEELYYRMGFEEDAMLILFTVDEGDSWTDWEYDMYCGDDTIRCLSDSAFDELLSKFHKGMANQNLYEALEYSWNEVIPDLAKSTINWFGLLPILFVLAFYSIFYIGIFASVKKGNDAYRYFKENPDKVDNTPMIVHAVCPSCGASNSHKGEKCLYCDTLLTITDGNTTYVR